MMIRMIVIITIPILVTVEAMITLTRQQSTPADVLHTNPRSSISCISSLLLVYDPCIRILVLI